MKRVWGCTNKNRRFPLKPEVSRDLLQFHQANWFCCLHFVLKKRSVSQIQFPVSTTPWKMSHGAPSDLPPKIIGTLQLREELGTTQLQGTTSKMWGLRLASLRYLLADFCQKRCKFTIKAATNQSVRTGPLNPGRARGVSPPPNDVFPKASERENSVDFPGCRNRLSAELFTKVCFKVTAPWLSKITECK